MNLEVVKGFHDNIVFHCYINRNCCFNSNEPQRDTSPVSRVRGGVTRTLSASIAHYRCQAKYFNGQPDGKIEVVPRETKHFQCNYECWRQLSGSDPTRRELEAVRYYYSALRKATPNRVDRASRFLSAVHSSVSGVRRTEASRDISTAPQPQS